MQINNNAGIIIYRKSKMPQMLSMLSLPRLENNIAIKGETQDINIYIFVCPVYGSKLDKKRYRSLKEMVDKHKIKFLVERFETTAQSNVLPKKDEPHYSQLLAEINAIKQFAALVKLSQDRQENLLAESIGFIMGNIDRFKIDLLSEEASKVMVYEAPNLTEQMKIKMHNDFMEKKGVSIIFSKNIKDIVDKCNVLSIDEEIDLSGSLEALKHKIVLGRSKIKELRTIADIILWTEDLQHQGGDKLPIIYNNEILAIMRYFYIKLDIIKFIKSLPHIYFDMSHV